MNQNNEGLTVGELTIALGVLIIALLIWSGVKQEKNTQKGIEIQDNYSLVVNN
ncbi:hypothetical protein [Prochlorococcus sp. MIT 1223]|uniref:hypothetical protein n=1 Tax=Prochlorococcus sp. MIT 1223 TaxID=3096217 RepID=UPI002A75C8CD|nr:hypothetical protein [Prochlorococcus sp. MIT 1223]